MRYLVYSDVHGNLPAMEAMLKYADDIDNFICLGDLVNYGPWSNECVDLALTLPNSILLMGNHEVAFIEGKYSGSNKLVTNFFDQCFPSFKRLEEIKTFKNEYQIGSTVLKHTISEKYIYPDTNVLLDRNYIIGHSHHQFYIDNRGFRLWNAGSVGQNRKYINRIEFLIYDTEKEFIDPCSITYDIEQLINEMKICKYPSDCIEYYLSKKKL
ncbi:putative phosphodiesterase [Dysgonomonas sp. PH5-45]|uniref:metallophosphoesterase family protein n=1 Tax=unclassified Dysgonomonas TaxID=2630389 RepID=UPI002473F740|nr:MULTISPECIES: metallophosphoesterase family protein [unclassified Dysgonomonas]MDH6355293.1 putative phosphodiesterase [Dysgonomonas sp. PH5-45]MDH6388181.1 putative phosphodiesterase [Dysgonomonas sp. PH5-37]